MSLRSRLILAFLVLSVVPLSAMTLIWYVSSVKTFERAAEREANETAADIGRRMEMVTANLGRRMDRLFDEAVGSAYVVTKGKKGETGKAKDETIQARIAPMLGDTAALLDRLEFHPSANPNPNPNPDPDVNPSPEPRGRSRAFERRGRPPRPPHARGPEAPSLPPPPPSPPPPVVVDVAKIIADAQRSTQLTTRELGPAIAEAIKNSVPKDVAGSVEASVRASMTAVNDAIAREAVAAAAAQKPEMEVSGQHIEVPVKKDGRVVGKANAMLNLDRTMHSVLSLARRDQGEIPFALDQQGRLYTPDPRARGKLESLGVKTLAPAAAEGQPRRIGDWILVARKDKEAGGMIFGIARPIDASLREIRRMSFRNLSMGLLVIALACVGIVPISRRMTAHVSSLTEGVKQLAGGDFKVRVPVQSRDEFGTLAASFNKMAEDLERNQSLVVERERLRRELELSRLIQTEMLPRAPLRLGSAEIKGLSIPAREVGGDFFNYFALPDGRLALLVGDVSGKGVSAALLMANVQATLRARMPLETELAQLADHLDREVDEKTPHSVYVTLFLGILDVERGVLRYVNAGHNPQFLLRQRGGIEPLSSTGMPIALYAGHGYRESVVDIASGDLLFFYTDGLVEAEDPEGDMFGAERLQAILETEHAERIETVIERVDAAVRTFRGSVELLDDATMMALRIDG